MQHGEFTVTFEDFSAAVTRAPDGVGWTVSWNDGPNQWEESYLEIGVAYARLAVLAYVDQNSPVGSGFRLTDSVEFHAVADTWLTSQVSSPTTV